jgi:hypothetical protein
MIEVYLDESGIHDEAEICLVAGYFGQPGAWEKLELRWKKILDRASVPLERFHALDLMEHRRVFFNMERNKHEKLISDLATAVSTFRVYPVAFGLVLADFHALSMSQKKFFTGATIDTRYKPGRLRTEGCPSKPYFMPFLHCVRQILDHTPNGATAQFYFGLDRPFYRYAVEMFKMIKARQDDPRSTKLGNSHLPEAKKTPQLQAADFLCYLTYKHMLARHAANNWNVMPAEPLRTLLRNMKQLQDLRFYDRDVIAECLQISYESVGNWDSQAAEDGL